MRKLTDKQTTQYFNVLKKVNELCIQDNPLEIHDLVEIVGVYDIQDKIIIELFGFDESMINTIEENIDIFKVSNFLSLIPFCKKAVIQFLTNDCGVEETIEI